MAHPHIKTLEHHAAAAGSAFGFAESDFEVRYCRRLGRAASCCSCSPRRRGDGAGASLWLDDTGVTPGRLGAGRLTGGHSSASFMPSCVAAKPRRS